MTDDLVKRLRDVGKNYELARGVHVDIRQAADRIEELEAKLNKLRAVSERALMLSLKYSHFKLHAMEPMHKAIAAAKIKGEQP